MGLSPSKPTPRVAQVLVENQQQLMINARSNCIKTIQKSLENLYSSHQRDGLSDDTRESEAYCSATWDGLACWPQAKAGDIVEQPCPDYVHNFLLS
ncbi:parathyroid hormone/parathyroid hormone-related peptide receptor, partial [Plakobranchus ocellatus]